MAPRPMPPPSLPIKEWTREDLLALLAHFEGELQARDVALAILRSEQKCLDHPKKDNTLKSLQSDLSNMNLVDDSEAYVQLYPHQFKQLNKLVDAQKEYQKKFAQRMLEIEDQHARQLFELRDKLEESERSIDRTRQGLCAVLEERVNALKNECTRKQKELDDLDEELKRRDNDLEEERERQKTMILYLLTERKQLLSIVHQMKLKMKDSTQSDSDTPSSSSSNVINELKKQLSTVCEERNKYSRQVNSLQSEKTNLLNVIHNLEEDVMSLKANSYINKPTEIGVGGYVVANKGALSTDLPSSTTTTTNQPYSDTTGTVRYNKQNTKNFPSKSLDYHQHNLINGNLGQRPYTSNDAPPSSTSSNLPRPSTTQTQRSHAPAMGIRGSQMRNSRPTMGITAHEDHRFSHPQQGQTANYAPSQFPTTAADMSGQYGASSSQSPRQQQVRMIPIDHQGPASVASNVIFVRDEGPDGRLTKRSTSLPRKMGNETVVQVKTTNHPSSPTKIRPPSSSTTTTNQNSHHQPVGSAPNFQPPIPQRHAQKTGHTHIS